MMLTKDMIFTILLFFGIGKYSEYNDPKYYEMLDVNGDGVVNILDIVSMVGIIFEEQIWIMLKDTI